MPCSTFTCRTVLALTGLAALACTAQADPRESYRGRDGAFLPFLPVHGHEGQPDLHGVPYLRVSFGGGEHGATMDTGSTGVVVSAGIIPDYRTLPSLRPAQLTYSSSGRIMEGRWVVTPMTVAGANGAAVTTRPVPVLAVEHIRCFSNARDCQPEDNPRGVAMLGIGFAREADHQAQSTPDKNPFLSLDSGRVRRGYVVTREGVHVGLTEANTRGDFAFVKLARDAGGRDWAAPPACITVNDSAAPACGTVLVDTGVTRMFLTVPPDQVVGALEEGPGRAELAPGTRIRIGLAGGAEFPDGYGFVVGEQRDRMAPNGITLVGIGSRPTFVNTSFNALNGFDYLYDADGGYVGYRFRK